MATNANFKFPKTYKRWASAILNKNVRNTFVKAMINAESTYASNKNRKFSDPATSQKPNKKETAGE